MNRRQMVQVAASTALAHGVVTVLGCRAEQTPAASPMGPKNAKEDHSAHAGAATTGSPLTPSLARLASSTADCVRVGETCLEHCIRDLASGSTMMADCAKVVQQMLAVCRATSSLAAMGSRYTPAQAKLCAEACADCAEECEKHAAHHDECRACFEACRAAEAAARSLA